MKKIYEAPTLEIELYQLDASIAGSCDSGHIVTWGPAYDGHTACAEFDKGGIVGLDLEVSFYDQSTVCNCYTTAGGENYFTS